MARRNTYIINKNYVNTDDSVELPSIGGGTTSEMNTITDMETGDFWLNSDTNTIWKYDGSAWIDTGFSLGNDVDLTNYQTPKLSNTNNWKTVFHSDTDLLLKTELGYYGVSGDYANLITGTTDYTDSYEGVCIVYPTNGSYRIALVILGDGKKYSQKYLPKSDGTGAIVEPWSEGIQSEFILTEPGGSTDPNTMTKGGVYEEFITSNSPTGESQRFVIIVTEVYNKSVGRTIVQQMAYASAFEEDYNTDIYTRVYDPLEVSGWTPWCAIGGYDLISADGKNISEITSDSTLFSAPIGRHDKGSYIIGGDSSSGMIEVYDYGNKSGYKKANAFFSNEVWTATFNSSGFSGDGWVKIAEEVKPYFDNTTVTTPVTLGTTPVTLTTITTDVPVKARGYLTALISRTGGTSAVGIVTVTLSDGSNTFTADYDIGRDLTSTIHLNTAKRLNLLAGTITLTANYTGTGTVTVNNISASLE